MLIHVRTFRWLIQGWVSFWITGNSSAIAWSFSVFSTPASVTFELKRFEGFALKVSTLYFVNCYNPFGHWSCRGKSRCLCWFCRSCFGCCRHLIRPRSHVSETKKNFFRIWLVGWNNGYRTFASTLYIIPPVWKKLMLLTISTNWNYIYQSLIDWELGDAFTSIDDSLLFILFSLTWLSSSLLSIELISVIVILILVEQDPFLQIQRAPLGSQLHVWQSYINLKSHDNKWVFPFCWRIKWTDLHTSVVWITNTSNGVWRRISRGCDCVE